jgi:hypothetical protein
MQEPYLELSDAKLSEVLSKSTVEVREDITLLTLKSKDYYLHVIINHHTRSFIDVTFYSPIASDMLDIVLTDEQKYFISDYMNDAKEENKQEGWYYNKPVSDKEEQSFNYKS